MSLSILPLTLSEGHWNTETAENDLVKGAGHSNQVQDMVIVGGVLVTCGMDDSIVYTDVVTTQYGCVDVLPHTSRWGKIMNKATQSLPHKCRP